MAKGLDFQSDQFLQLLTDALRAGPTSPQWHQAVARLPAMPDADPYQQLLDARQNLESGKSYRSVRPGPGFTRKVMAALAVQHQDEGGGRSWHSWASLATGIAIFATLVAVVSVVIMTRSVSSPAPRPTRPWTVEELGALAFEHPDGGPISFESKIPPGWLPIGSLGVVADHGLQLKSMIKEVESGGGLWRSAPLSPDVPLELDLRVRYVSGAGVVPEIFITDTPTFTDNPTGTSPHELVWTMLGDRAQVQLPDLSFVGDGEPIPPHQPMELPVRIKLDVGDAIVETADGRYGRWEGPHQLAPNKPRFVGVRFLVRRLPQPGKVAIEGTRINRY